MELSLRYGAELSRLIFRKITLAFRGPYSPRSQWILSGANSGGDSELDTPRRAVGVSKGVNGRIYNAKEGQRLSETGNNERADDGSVRLRGDGFGGVDL
jgi:hypothetical protein